MKFLLSIKSAKDVSLEFHSYQAEMKHIPSKLQGGNFWLFTKYSQILNIVHNFGQFQRRHLIYRPDIYNLPTRFASLPFNG